MNFYKSVIEHHGKLLVRGIHNGQEFKEKIDYSPTLYAISQQDTEFKTLSGQSLKPIQFGSIKKAREFSKANDLLFRRNSVSGQVECLRNKSTVALNSDLHKSN